MILTPDHERSMRVINALCSGAAFAALSVVGVLFLRYRDIGHRLLISVVSVTFAIRATANFFSAWEAYFYGTRHWEVWLFFVSALSSDIMAGTVITAFGNIVITLRTSEAQDRIRADRAADAQMAEWNLEYLSQSTKLKSLELLESQHRCSAPAATKPAP